MFCVSCIKITREIDSKLQFGISTTIRRTGV